MLCGAVLKYLVVLLQRKGVFKRCHVLVCNIVRRHQLWNALLHLEHLFDIFNDSASVFHEFFRVYHSYLVLFFIFSHHVLFLLLSVINASLTDFKWSAIRCWIFINDLMNRFAFLFNVDLLLILVVVFGVLCGWCCLFDNESFSLSASLQVAVEWVHILSMLWRIAAIIVFILE